MNENVKLISEILEKIKMLPFDTETTMAEIIDYKPELNFVDPLIQGQIFNTINDRVKKKIYILKEIEMNLVD